MHSHLTYGLMGYNTHHSYSKQRIIRYCSNGILQSRMESHALFVIFPFDLSETLTMHFSAFWLRLAPSYSSLYTGCRGTLYRERSMHMHSYTHQ